MQQTYLVEGYPEIDMQDLPRLCVDHDIRAMSVAQTNQMAHHAANGNRASILKAHGIPADRVVTHFRKEVSHDGLEILLVVQERLDQFCMRVAVSVLYDFHVVAEFLRVDVHWSEAVGL